MSMAGHKVSKQSSFDNLAKFYKDIDVVGRIAEGGFGKIYLGVHPVTQREFAIKKQPRDISSNSQIERDLHVRTDGFFLVKTLYAVRTDTHEYMVFEKFVGDLYVIRPGKSLVTAFVANQIGLALEYLHALGYIHRDLKPGNILITRDYKVKLNDFGLCCKQDAPAARVGTPGYHAPEIAKGHRATSYSDWYCFGLIVYYLETGEDYHGSSVQRIQIYKIRGTEARFAKIDNPDVRQWCKSFCDPRLKPSQRMTYFKSQGFMQDIILETNSMSWTDFLSRVRPLEDNNQIALKTPEKKLDFQVVVDEYSYVEGMHGAHCRERTETGKFVKSTERIPLLCEPVYIGYKRKPTRDRHDILNSLRKRPRQV
ncbi:unnamed protein product [Allacma fusca]|uniref:Serine/threonine-protein kinase greatwall n=1 Tax=Allacma fusca TaxID=39272 RepID=A0A8J2NKB3_9HEXA|nr:unnamed protein product [Allacma fusca]